MAWLSPYSKRVQLTIDSSVIDSNLTHFPIPIFLDSSAGKSSKDITEIFDDLGANSKKIAVTESDGTTQLYVEIEQWDNVNEKAVLWVSKSDWTLSSSSDTEIYLYFDNTQADNNTYVADIGSRTEVWDTDFKTVQHLENTTDATNTHTLTEVNSPTRTATKIGNGLSLDGSTNYAELADSNDWDSNQFTVSCWFYEDSMVVQRPLLSRWESSPKVWALNKGYSDSNDFRFYVRSGSNSPYGKTSVNLSNNTWYHVYVIYDGTGSTNTDKLKIYINGSLASLSYDGTLPATLNTNEAKFYIGAGLSNAQFRYWNGDIDEVRFSDTNRDASWGKLEYYSGDDNLITFGDIESFSVSLTEIFSLSDTWDIATNPEFSEINETFTLDDSWEINSNPQQESITETFTLSDTWDISTVEDVSLASKIISYNPLIYVTNTNPAKIVKVDITDPANLISSVYTIASNSYAKDVILNDTSDYFYVICNNAKIVKINKNDLNDQIIINTNDTDNLLEVDDIETSFMTFASTDDSNGEIILLDERTVKQLNSDLRWRQLITNIIPTRLDRILGKLINSDLRWKSINTKTLRTDLRWLAVDYDETYKYAISYTDWQVYINGTELTVLDDVDMNSIVISHRIDQEEVKASEAQFTLNRRYDKLNYTNTGTSSEITNNNTVSIVIKGHTEFTGKIYNINADSENEIVNVTAIGTRPAYKLNRISIPMPSVNEQLNLYHCLINNITIDNPYVDPNDETPDYYKGIQIDLGTKITQNIKRYSSFGNTENLAEDIENGDFTPKQNWTYFWLAGFTHLILGLVRGVLTYIGTSLGSLSSDAWRITRVAYKYQKELEDTEEELGIYQVGEAPFNEISVQNGKKITKDKWVDDRDGMYIVKDEGYDYEEYAKQVAELEYQKLLNINGQVLPITSADISISVDAYYYYGIALLTRINVSNTTTSSIYVNANGFPVSVKAIRIQCTREGTNSMIVNLTCDNSLSQVELDEIDNQYPDEESDEFVFPETRRKLYSKFDPNSWGYPD